MSNDKQVDPASTYVLEETSITRLNSLEELAELALGGRKEESRPTGDSRVREARQDRSQVGTGRPLRERGR